MGYSGRYHAASLAAVFIALAIGILIGIGLADDVVSTASQELESSLRDERDAARDDVADLEGDIDRERQFSDDAYPALVDGRLARQQVAVVELGDVPATDVDVTAEEAISAIGEAGGKLASVSSVSLPPDVEPLVDAAGRRFAMAKRDPAALEDLGAAIGSQIVGGGGLIERVKPELFASFNGSLEGVSRVVLIRNPAEELSAADQAAADAFEAGLVAGIEQAARGSAGVERSSTDPPTLAIFSDLGVATIDHVDTPAGKVSLTYALAGAKGDFGTKEGATSFLPELLPEPRSR